MTRKELTHVGLTGLLTLIGFTACRHPDGGTSALPLASSRAAALHAVHSAQLKSLMAQLRGLDLERLPQELEGGAGRQPYLERVDQAATAMAAATTRIPDALADSSLGESEQRVFRVLADRLRVQSLDLGERARRGDEQGIRSTMKELTSTCVACHALFRDSPEP